MLGGSQQFAESFERFFCGITSSTEVPSSRQKDVAKKKKKEKSDQTVKRALIFDFKLQNEKMVNLLINIVLFCFLVFPGEQEADVERETRATGKVPRPACLALHVLFVLA